MFRKLIPLAVVGLMVLLLSSVPLAVNAFSTGQSAATVIGQPDFTSGAQFTASGLPIHDAPNASNLYSPEAVAFDSKGDLWVADGGNNRVLEYAHPVSDDQPAALVIGQTKFNSSAKPYADTTASNLSSPAAIAFDSQGDLWVADQGNSRVLEYAPPFSSGQAASLVIGEPDFTSYYSTSVTPSSLRSPSGLAFDSHGDLWVADTADNRVLEYAAPLSSGQAAVLVIGQSNFTSSAPGYYPTASTLESPAAVTFDSQGDLWIVDGAGRVLELAPPFSNGQSASLVVGQPDFTSYPQMPFAATASSTNVPTDASFDSIGNLWVADFGNSRVLEFAPAFSNGESASLVVGQPDFTTSAMGATAASLGSWGTAAHGFVRNGGVAFDSHGNLWVTDTPNNRVLEFEKSSSSGTTTTSTPSSSTTSTSLATANTGVSQTSTSASSSSTSNGVPEFPFQLFAVSVLTALVLASYLAARRRQGGSRRGTEALA